MYFTNGFIGLVAAICLNMELVMGVIVPSASEEYSPVYPGMDKKFDSLQIKDDTYGVRNVTYWVTDDDYAVIDGDVIYGPLSHLMSKKHTGEASNNTVEPRAHSIFRGVNSWPQATVIYRFDSDVTERAISGIVNDAINRWRTVAPYLTFTRLANSNVPQNGVIIITANDCGGCNANVGYYSNFALRMNLQQACPTAPGRCTAAEATHEFGHILGFHHEHQRADRENTIHYECRNLNPNCNNMPAGTTCCNAGIPSNCCTLAFNFNLYVGPQYDSTGPYDTSSIMQYRADAFAIPGTKTMLPARAGVVVPEHNIQVISALDQARVCKIYAAPGTAC